MKQIFISENNKFEKNKYKEDDEKKGIDFCQRALSFLLKITVLYLKWICKKLSKSYTISPLRLDVQMCNG